MAVDCPAPVVASKMTPSIFKRTTSPALSVCEADTVTASFCCAASCPPSIRFLNSESGVVGIIIEPSEPPSQLTSMTSLA